MSFEQGVIFAVISIHMLCSHQTDRTSLDKPGVLYPENNVQNAPYDQAGTRLPYMKEHIIFL